MIRPATPADVPTIAELIRGLAEYERLSDYVTLQEDLLAEHLFGKQRFAEVLLAEDDGVVAGFALFFHNYSTFLGQPGIYLEDLFVRPELRGQGYGKAALVRRSQISPPSAVAAGSNGPFSIGMNRRCASINRWEPSRWTNGRLIG